MNPATGVRILFSWAFRRRREIANLARTSAAIGTPPSKLAQTLQARYGRAGLKARIRQFERIESVVLLNLVPPEVKKAFHRFARVLDHESFFDFGREEGEG